MFPAPLVLAPMCPVPLSPTGNRHRGEGTARAGPGRGEEGIEAGLGAGPDSHFPSEGPASLLLLLGGEFRPRAEGRWQGGRYCSVTPLCSRIPHAAGSTRGLGGPPRCQLAGELLGEPRARSLQSRNFAGSGGERRQPALCSAPGLLFVSRDFFLQTA